MRDFSKRFHCQSKANKSKKTSIENLKSLTHQYKSMFGSTMPTNRDHLLLKEYTCPSPFWSRTLLISSLQTETYHCQLLQNLRRYSRLVLSYDARPPSRRTLGHGWFGSECIWTFVKFVHQWRIDGDPIAMFVCLDTRPFKSLVDNWDYRGRSIKSAMKVYRLKRPNNWNCKRWTRGDLNWFVI